MISILIYSFSTSDSEHLDKHFLSTFKSFVRSDGENAECTQIVKLSTDSTRKCALKSDVNDEIEREYENGQYQFSYLALFALSQPPFLEVSVCSARWDMYSWLCLSRLLMDIARYRMLYIYGILAHGAVVVQNDRAIMFCGLSGAGKSTQAELWHTFRGAWVLNYDRTAIVNKDGQYYAHGTPWSGKERCYINAEVPLKSIVFVKQSSDNKARRLTPTEAYALLYPNFMVYPITSEIAERYESAVTDLSVNMPVYEYQCTNKKDAADYLSSFLFGENDEEIVWRMNIMRKNDGFLLKNIADEWIIIPRGEHALDFSATILLNETGAFLWNCLDKNLSIDQLVGELVREYSVDIDVASNDVKEFVKQMCEAGVISE